jgi:hypothetical protein
VKYKGFQGLEKRRGEGNGSMVRRKGGIQWFQWFKRRRGEGNGTNGDEEGRNAMVSVV